MRLIWKIPQRGVTKTSLRYLTKAKRAENLENELCGQVRRKFGSFYLMWS